MSENDFENTTQNTVSIEKTTGSETSVDSESLLLENEELHTKIKELTGEISAAQIENGELKANVLKMTQIVEDHRWEIRRLKNQIEDLTKTPFFIATVMEIFDEEVLIKLHGNNQEILTHTAPDLKTLSNPECALLSTAPLMLLWMFSANRQMFALKLWNSSARRMSVTIRSAAWVM